MRGIGEYLLYAQAIAPSAFITAGNTLIALSFSFYTLAIGEFSRTKPNYPVTVVPVMAIVVFFIVLGERPEIRVVSSSLIFGSQLTFFMVTLFRLKIGLRSRLLMLIGVGISAAIFFNRAAWAIINPEYFRTVLNTNLVRSITLTSGYVGNLLMAIGLVSFYLQHENEVNYKLARIDPLTEIHNRRSLFDLAGSEIQRARRSEKQFSVLMVDLDNFKAINDNYGHQVGDDVLRYTAGVMKLVFRRQDIVARYGGEEFCVILPDTDQSGAQTVAERLRTSLATQDITANKTAVNVTASIGVYTVDPTGDLKDVESILSLADQAMYRAKQLGKNRVATLDL